MRRVPPPPVLDEPDLERAIARLRTTTRAKGLKNSSARESIARVALRRQGHFSVEELVAELRAGEVANAHPATVYRVLPLLVEAGLLQVTLVSQGEGVKYERAFEREHHDHLICTVCGQVVEFHSEAIENLQRELATTLGFQLTGHIHELFGICQSCHVGSAAR